MKKITKNHVDKDFEYARKSLYELSKINKDSVNDLRSLTKDLDSPRAYEVLATLIRQNVDIEERILQLHQKSNDIAKSQKSIDGGSQSNITNNITFTGTSTDFQKSISNDINTIDGTAKEIDDE